MRAGGEPARPADRVAVLFGTTRTVETPYGSVLVTVNETASGEPTEVFVRAGQTGSDLAGFAEAIGRLCTLCLRLPSTSPPAARLDLIADELVGIGGAPGASSGRGVRSLPDAVARALAAHAAGGGYAGTGECAQGTGDAETSTPEPASRSPAG